VEGSEYPNNPRIYVVWGYMPRVSQGKQVLGQTKSGSKNLSEDILFYLQEFVVILVC